MNTDGTGFHTCKECHKTGSLWNHTTTDHKEGEQLEDRRSVGASSCNSGDGTDHRVQSLMFIMMMMMMMMIYVSHAHTDACKINHTLSLRMNPLISKLVGDNIHLKLNINLENCAFRWFMLCNYDNKWLWYFFQIPASYLYILCLLDRASLW